MRRTEIQRKIMKEFIEERKVIILEEAKEELSLCDLIWKEKFLDCFNFTPDFEFGQEENASFFKGCMMRLIELDLILEQINKL